MDQACSLRKGRFDLSRFVIAARVDYALSGPKSADGMLRKERSPDRRFPNRIIHHRPFGDLMPLIQVQQTPGKTSEQKAELVRALTDAYVSATNSKPESVWVTIQETATDSWSIGGKTLAARAAGK